MMMAYLLLNVIPGRDINNHIKTNMTVTGQYLMHFKIIGLRAGKLWDRVRFPTEAIHSSKLSDQNRETCSFISSGYRRIFLRG
jgi:hypothetical protein